MRWGILDDDGGYFYCITYTLDAILATTAEQEDRQLVRIQMESRDNQGAKPVDASAYPYSRKPDRCVPP